VSLARRRFDSFLQRPGGAWYNFSIRETALFKHNLKHAGGQDKALRKIRKWAS
jgi:hypothetical protein